MEDSLGSSSYCWWSPSSPSFSSSSYYRRWRAPHLPPLPTADGDLPVSLLLLLVESSPSSSSYYQWSAKHLPPSTGGELSISLLLLPVELLLLLLVTGSGRFCPSRHETRGRSSDEAASPPTFHPIAIKRFVTKRLITERDYKRISVHLKLSLVVYYTHLFSYLSLSHPFYSLFFTSLSTSSLKTKKFFSFLKVREVVGRASRLCPTLFISLSSTTLTTFFFTSLSTSSPETRGSFSC